MYYIIQPWTREVSPASSHRCYSQGAEFTGGIEAVNWSQMVCILIGAELRRPTSDTRDTSVSRPFLPPWGGAGLPSHVGHEGHLGWGNPSLGCPPPSIIRSLTQPKCRRSQESRRTRVVEHQKPSPSKSGDFLQLGGPDPPLAGAFLLLGGPDPPLAGVMTDVRNVTYPPPWERCSPALRVLPISSYDVSYIGNIDDSYYSRQCMDSLAYYKYNSRG